VRVVIGEDSALFREGLARLLEDAGHEVVAKAADAPTVVVAVEETLPELKDRVFDVDDFLDALRRVAAGGSALDPEVVSTLLGHSGYDDPLALLTAREQEGPRADGRGTHQCRHCQTSLAHRPNRREHVASIMAKLGLRESTENRRVLAVLTWLGLRTAAG
jgi:chemotaxis response regulator CheB